MSGRPATGSDAVTLRPMRWWDLTEVAALEREVFALDPWTDGQFWGELAHVPQTREYVVATDGDGIAGYAGLYAVPPDAEVQTLAVAPRARGTGLGERLLACLVAAARRRGCTRMFLEVRADNAPARRQYERCGFEAGGTRRDYYGPGSDAVVMRRRLDAPEREPADG